MLNQDGALDGPLGKFELLLGVVENVGPQLGLFRRLELRQVEIGSGAFLD